MRVDKGFHAEKLRDLHFDLLIALTARSVGARLVYLRSSDFELIASYRRLQLGIWSATAGTRQASSGKKYVFSGARLASALGNRFQSRRTQLQMGIVVGGLVPASG